MKILKAIEKPELMPWFSLLSDLSRYLIISLE